MAKDCIILAVRSDEPADGIHALPGERPDSVEPEQGDGESISSLRATGVWAYELSANGGKDRLLDSYPSINATVQLTGSRVTFACSKFVKGSGFSLTGMAVSHSIAAARRRNKTLVGQVRYEWIESVGASSKTSTLSFERLRLVCVDWSTGSPRRLALSMSLPSDIDAGNVAQEVMQRYAFYWLNSNADLPEDRRTALAGLLQDPPALPSRSKELTEWHLPCVVSIGATAADYHDPGH